VTENHEPAYGRARASAADAVPVFDERAAVHYDELRAISGETLQQLIQLLRPELVGRGRCLDVGVGTGRLALPLGVAGIPVVGIDLSAPMLAQLRRKTAAFSAMPVVQGDATALPFASHRFGAAIMCHVLHLIPQWRVALAEVCRVVRPGGVLLLDLGGGHERQSAQRVVRERFRIELDLLGSRPPQFRREAVDEALRIRGAVRRDLSPILERRRTSLEQVIRSLEHGWTWRTSMLPDHVRYAAATRTRDWARQRFGDLAAVHEERRRIVWRAYEVPDGD